MKAAHFVLQGKGGVGKSFAATILAQYLADRLNGQLPLHCYDTDPVNQTFTRYKALQAKMVPILNQDDVIDSRKFDSLIEDIITEEGIAVTDNGAATFVPLLGYMTENHIADLLKESGVDVYFHVVITGGQAMEDTIVGLKTVLDKLNGKVVVWANEYFGELSQAGKPVQEFKVISDNQDKIIGVVKIARRTADTFGKDIENMVKANLTFEEAKKSFHLLPRQRLMMVQRDLYAELDQQSFGGSVLPPAGKKAG
ncbi:conjugal transfer protein TraL [Snodgrassella sp. CFCC 13594]|uniref:conjugal transfer protein TraL n=1 Tax=Snodgrassella sp. CFCC 13594 TaxID=1775559 RepID=UPI0008316CE6|nr:conjugal transfer protein TraL [Snodgrassella sp. CFCC 13594]